MPKDKNLLEILDTYAEMIDEQAEIIQKLVGLTRKQAVEIRHYKSIAGCEDLEQPDDDEKLIKKASELINEEP